MRDEFKERLGQIAQGRGTGWRSHRERPIVSLDELPGSVRTDGVLIVERSLSELISMGEQQKLLARLKKVSEAAANRDDLHDDVRSLVSTPDRALFFDTETTGLGGNMVFMLGTMRVSDTDVRLVQVFARDYREEKALLEVWSEMLGASGMLVSFNGKSFDAPVLRDRLALHGMVVPEEPPHLDLLHHARRRWKGAFSDCRLQTLEWQICGRRRSGDIPGAEIPGVYHHFVRTGETADILSVFHHNALDLITLADIAVELIGPAAGPRGRRA